MEATHLLIPIEEMDKLRAEDFHKRPHALKEAVRAISKQIALDEESVEKKAEAEALKQYTKKENPQLEDKSRLQLRLGWFEGYKQALKDILE